MKQEKGQKTFTAYFDDGSKYSFSLNESATAEDAKKYATVWNEMAGRMAWVVRIAECEPA